MTRRPTKTNKHPPEDRRTRARAQKKGIGSVGALPLNPDILKEFRKAVRRAGYVGDARVVLLLFLALTSRLLPNPVSMIVKGSSGGGKSFPLEVTLKFFPRSAYRKCTRLSPNALAYMGDDLVHRSLVVFEAAGIEDEDVRTSLRTLLTEHRVVYKTVGPDKKPITRVTRGPTNLLTTTTKAKLHEETETRLLSVRIEESSEQTRKILIEQATERAERPPVDYEQWRALQEYLESKSTDVVVPFWRSVASLVGNAPTRIHRDFIRLRTLVAAHALLHRRTREKTASGQVVAKIADYSAVRKLVKSFFDEALEAAVPRETCELVDAVRQLLVSQPTVGAPELAEKLGLHRTTISRRVRVAMEEHYLRNVEPNPHKPLCLVLGDPLPSERSVLPRSSAVREHHRASQKRNDG